MMMVCSLFVVRGNIELKSVRHRRTSKLSTICSADWRAYSFSKPHVDIVDIDVDVDAKESDDPFR
jgi:hypothetical protein